MSDLLSIQQLIELIKKSNKKLDLLCKQYFYQLHDDDYYRYNNFELIDNLNSKIRINYSYLDYLDNWEHDYMDVNVEDLFMI